MGLDVSFKLGATEDAERLAICPGRIGYVAFIACEGIVPMDYYGGWVEISKKNFRKICLFLRDEGCEDALPIIAHLYFMKGQIWMSADW